MALLRCTYVATGFHRYALPYALDTFCCRTLMLQCCFNCAAVGGLVPSTWYSSTPQILWLCNATCSGPPNLRMTRMSKLAQADDGHCSATRQQYVQVSFTIHAILPAHPPVGYTNVALRPCFEGQCLPLQISSKPT